MVDVTDRLALLAALADPHRLAVVDALADGDLAPGELAARLAMASSLLAHHLHALEAAGAIERRRSDADGRRAYLSLRWSPLVEAAVATAPAAASATHPEGVPPGHPDATAPDHPDHPRPAHRPPRVVFTCTRNSARSQLAAAMLAARRIVPVASAGTDPDPRIHPLTLDELARRGLEPVALAPASLDDVLAPGDLVVAVCDRAYESSRADLHWSVADPAEEGTSRAFHAACEALAPRVDRLAASLAARPALETSPQPA